MTGPGYVGGTNPTAASFLTGTISSAEDIYYLNYYFSYNTAYGVPAAYDACTYGTYREFMDNDIAQLSRYQYRQRVKIIVDDDTTAKP